MTQSSGLQSSIISLFMKKHHKNKISPTRVIVFSFFAIILVGTGLLMLPIATTDGQIPFVDDYKLVFHGPTKLEVIVYEKDIVGYVSDMSSYMYFDRDGIVVESSSSKLEGVPWITGLHFGQLILHRPLPVEDQTVFQDILNLTQQLSLHQLSVDRIEYNSHKKATLYMGEMEVTLGDDTNIDSKISVLSDILAAQPQLVGIPGVIELENYNEEGIGGGITFKKK